RAGWDLSHEAAPVPRRESRARVLEPATGLTVVPRPIEQANVLVGMAGLTATDPRRSVLSVLNSILGGGMSSRLFQEVRERRGLAYAVYSFSPSYSDAGLFGMYAGCAPGKVAQVTEIMLSEFERVATHGVTDAELQ